MSNFWVRAPRPAFQMPADTNVLRVVLSATIFVQVLVVRGHAQLALVEQRPSDKPGYETEVTLLAEDQSVLGKLDLLHGERVAEQNSEQIVFVRRDGTHFRLRAPFSGRPVPFDPNADAAVDIEVTPEQAGAVGGIAIGAGRLISWFVGEGAQPPVSTPEPAPTPTLAPTPVPRASPSPPDQPVWTAIVRGERLVCIDARSGSTRNSVNLSGPVLSGPVVTGDFCTLTVQTPSGAQARTYKLPGLSLQNSTSL